MRSAAYDLTIDDLLKPEIFLPSQFMRRRDELIPELKLMLAVLLDALRCYQTYCRTRRRADEHDFLDAERWLFGPGNGATFSCDSICDFLDVEIGNLRRVLQQWREKLSIGEKVHRFRRAPVTLPSPALTLRHRMRTRKSNKSGLNQIRRAVDRNYSGSSRLAENIRSS